MTNSPAESDLIRRARLAMALGRDGEAMALFGEALADREGATADHFDFAVLLFRADRFTEAVRQFERSTRFEDASANTFLNLARTRLKIGDAIGSVAAFDEALRRGAGADARSDRLLALNYVPDLTEDFVAEEHFRAGPMFGKETRSREDFESLRQEPSDKPLRIGILSPDLRSHPIGRFLRPLLPRLRSSGFEILAYSSTPEPDQITAELRSSCSVWRECLGSPDTSVEKHVLSDRPHILLDLSGHTARNRMGLVARRLAPVQFHWIGYPNTTGIPSIDFAIGDPVETPTETHRFFSEAIVTMPDAYVCYEPQADLGETGPLPRLANGFVTFGSLNNPAKINDAVLEVWAAILRDVPESQLLLRYWQYEDPLLREKFRRFFEDRGIEPDRVELIAGGTPREAIETYRRIDIALDTFPYSGGLTTCEAISRGVPVVALRGRGFAGRHSATHLTNAGLPDWIADNGAAYVRRALEAADDPDRLATLRKTLPDGLARSPLGDADRFASHFSTAMRAVVEQWRDGGPPSPIVVSPDA